MTIETPPVVQPATPFHASRPRAAAAHLLRTENGHHLLVVDGSRLFDVDEATFDRLNAALDDAGVDAILHDLGLLEEAPRIDDTPPTGLPIRALSLAVAQKCNLGCTYCYAQGGSFGTAPQNMERETARAAVDMMLCKTNPSERINLAFLGGEPLVNRAVLRDATTYAARQTAARGQQIGFSITTNGTLVTADDADFFEQHGFAVTISLDGPADIHDRQRPYKGGHGSFHQIMRRLGPLLAKAERMQVTARVTVTPDNLNLRETLDTLLELGFYSVGFSPMLASPTGRGEMRQADLEAMLAAMISCGEEFERRVSNGQPYAFANLITALQEIHRGTHRPYPCGAGGGYLGVAADGALAACHRFVGENVGAMGSVGAGVDLERQTRWLAARHVHRQSPCQACWARYLCAGGCHHEVIARGRSACDFIRGWLHYALQVYLRLSAAGVYGGFRAGARQVA